MRKRKGNIEEEKEKMKNNMMAEAKVIKDGEKRDEIYFAERK